MEPLNLLELPAEIIAYIVSQEHLDIQSLLTLRNISKDMKIHADVELFKRRSKEARKMQKKIINNGTSTPSFSVDEQVLLDYLGSANFKKQSAFTKINSFLVRAHKKKIKLEVPSTAFKQLLAQLEDADLQIKMAACFATTQLMDRLTMDQLSALTETIKRQFDDISNESNIKIGLILISKCNPYLTGEQRASIIDVLIPSLTGNTMNQAWEIINAHAEITPTQIQAIVEPYLRQPAHIVESNWYARHNILKFIIANLDHFNKKQIDNLVLQASFYATSNVAGFREARLQLMAALWLKLDTSQRQDYLNDLKNAFADVDLMRADKTPIKFWAHIRMMEYQQQCPEKYLSDALFQQFMMEIQYSWDAPYLAYAIIECVLPLLTKNQLSAIYDSLSQKMQDPNLETRELVFVLCRMLLPKLDDKFLSIIFPSFFSKLNESDTFIRFVIAETIVLIPNVEKMIPVEQLHVFVSKCIQNLSEVHDDIWHEPDVLMNLNKFVKPEDIDILYQPILQKIANVNAQMDPSELDALAHSGHQFSAQEVNSLYARFIKTDEQTNQTTDHMLWWRVLRCVARHFDSAQSLHVFQQILSENRSIVYQDVFEDISSNLNTQDMAQVVELLQLRIEASKSSSYLLAVALGMVETIAPKLTSAQAASIFDVIIQKFDQVNEKPIAFAPLGRAIDVFLNLLPKLEHEHVVTILEKIPQILYLTDYFNMKSVKEFIGMLLLSDRCHHQLLDDNRLSGQPISVYLQTIYQWCAAIQQHDLASQTNSLPEGILGNLTLFSAPSEISDNEPRVVHAAHVPPGSTNVRK